MLKKVGAFSKDPISETCVTVCGAFELNASVDLAAVALYVVVAASYKDWRGA
jgi:hypothetical protein